LMHEPTLEEFLRLIHTTAGLFYTIVVFVVGWTIGAFCVTMLVLRDDIWREKVVRDGSDDQ